VVGISQVLSPRPVVPTAKPAGPGGRGVGVKFG
jgi:hypothetical protein